MSHDRDHPRKPATEWEREQLVKIAQRAVPGMAAWERFLATVRCKPWSPPMIVSAANRRVVIDCTESLGEKIVAGLELLASTDPDLTDEERARLSERAGQLADVIAVEKVNRGPSPHKGDG